MSRSRWMHVRDSRWSTAVEIPAGTARDLDTILHGDPRTARRVARSVGFRVSET